MGITMAMQNDSNIVIKKDKAMAHMLQDDNVV